MMSLILAGFVAVLHLYFLYLEMFAWDTHAGRKSFDMTAEFSAATRALAANQGLYNGFLAAGLVWGIWLGDGGFAIRNFFLICVVVAGVFGFATLQPRVGRKIVLFQALPGAVALIANLLHF